MTPDNDCVICPNCVHQFRAIPVNVQTALTAAQALAERHANTLADINDGLRNILNDSIEGMERERIEEIADNWKDMIARAERAQALAEQRGMELKARDDIQLRVDAEFENLRAELERYKKDAERMDWLERQYIEVRLPLLYEELFWVEPDVEEGKSELRATIDAALSAKSEGGGR